MAPATKYGGKIVRVPARHDRHREVEADDGVDRNDQRRRDAGEQQVRGFVAVPVHRRPAPAERQHAVDDPSDARLRPIAQRREVGHQADEPEQQRNRGVGRDREHVPDERAAELRPHAHRVRIREQPVGQPRAPGVEQREDARARDREQRHRLGEPVDRRAPRLLQQQQDRRDQRAGVPDADPPDEVGDVEAPSRPGCCCPRCRCP